MKKIFLLIILTSLMVGSIPNNAYACSCVSPDPPLQSLEGSDAVFLGKVTNTEGIPGVDKEFAGDDEVMVTFEVSKVWKGPSDETLVIRTALDGSLCGLGRTFMIGEEYLVYASAFEEGSELWAGLCSRTTQISNAQEDLAELNRLGGRPPEDPDSTPQSDFEAISPTYYYLVLGAVGLVITAIIVIKRWPR